MMQKRSWGEEALPWSLTYVFHNCIDSLTLPPLPSTKWTVSLTLKDHDID